MRAASTPQAQLQRRRRNREQIAFLLLALPLAVWLDLTELSKTVLRRQASDANSLITSVRSYYATNVPSRNPATLRGCARCWKHAGLAEAGVSRLIALRLA